MNSFRILIFYEKNTKKCHIKHAPRDQSIEDRVECFTSQQACLLLIFIVIAFNIHFLLVFQHKLLWSFRLSRSDAGIFFNVCKPMPVYTIIVIFLTYTRRFSLLHGQRTTLYYYILSLWQCLFKINLNWFAYSYILIPLNVCK